MKSLAHLNLHSKILPLMLLANENTITPLILFMIQLHSILSWPKVQCNIAASQMCFLVSFFVAGSGSQPDENHLKGKFQILLPDQFPELTLYPITTVGSSAWQRTRPHGQNTGLPQSAFRLFLAALYHVHAQSRFDQVNLHTKTSPASKARRFW